jgi:hypothetical protein
MDERILSIFVGIAAFAFLVAAGMACTFYPYWVQRIFTKDWDRSSKLAFLDAFGQWVVRSRFFIWNCRVSGIGALAAAVILFYGLVRALRQLFC